MKIPRYFVNIATLQCKAFRRRFRLTRTNRTFYEKLLKLENIRFKSPPGDQEGFLMATDPPGARRKPRPANPYAQEIRRSCSPACICGASEKPQNPALFLHKSYAMAGRT